MAGFGLAVVALVLSGCGGEEPLTREGPDRDTVAAEVRLPVRDVESILLERFGTLPVSEPPLLHLFEAVPAGRNEDRLVSLPSDANLIGWSPSDPAMQRYVALPPEQRQHDIYLYELMGYWWFSEYRIGGVAVEFRSEFLLHLSSADDRRTRIEVIEVFPKVNAGRKFGWAYDTVLPGWKLDIRRVPPTVTDRERVLDHVLAVLARESERR